MPVAPHADIGTATVRPIPLAEAAKVIKQHEYLCSMPAFARWAFGIFFGEHCGGAVVYGDKYAENRGVWDRYNFTGRIVALKRGACLPWAHPHSASKVAVATLKRSGSRSIDLRISSRRIIP
jgi:hypothetical protein